MAIAQDAFFIPDDIATGLATGLYRRMGSVVRYAIGQNKDQIVKQHKKGTIIVATGAAIVGTSV